MTLYDLNRIFTITFQWLERCNRKCWASMCSFYFSCVCFVLIIMCYKNLCEIARNSILNCYFIFHFWNEVENNFQDIFKFEWLGSLNGFTWLSWNVLFKMSTIPRDNKSCFYPSSFTLLPVPSLAGGGVSEWPHRV